MQRKQIVKDILRGATYPLDYSAIQARASIIFHAELPMASIRRIVNELELQGIDADMVSATYIRGHKFVNIETGNPYVQALHSRRAQPLKSAA